MTFEEAFWKTFKKGLMTGSSPTQDLFLDRLKINGRENRRLARKSIQSARFEVRFKQSTVYKTALSSVQADPLEYIPTLEIVVTREIKYLKDFWLDNAIFDNVVGNARKDVEMWEEVLKTIRGLIQ